MSVHMYTCVCAMHRHSVKQFLCIRLPAIIRLESLPGCPLFLFPSILHVHTYTHANTHTCTRHDYTQKYTQKSRRERRGGRGVAQTTNLCCRIRVVKDSRFLELAFLLI